MSDLGDAQLEQLADASLTGKGINRLRRLAAAEIRELRAENDELNDELADSHRMRSNWCEVVDRLEKQKAENAKLTETNNRLRESLCRDRSKEVISEGCFGCK